MRKDWIEIELGKVCEIVSGKNQKAVENPTGKYPIYGSGGIFGRANEYLCEPGTTIIGRKGTINSPIYVNQRFWNVDTAFGISPSKEIDSKYVFYFCKGFNFHKLDKSTTIPSLAKRDILSITFPLAPLPEQRAIVAKIEQLFSELDNGITNLKAAKEKLEIYRQAVLKKAFEGELTKEWRRGLNHDLKSGNQANHQNQGAYNKLPEGWKQVLVKEISDKIQYGYTESASTEKIGPKFLRITDIQNNTVSWSKVPYCKITDSDFHKYQLIDGDIVFARTGATVGKSFLIKGNIPKTVFASYLIRIRLTKTVFDKYVWNYFQSHLYWTQIKKKSVGTGQPNVKEIKIPLPPLPEQHQIVKEIETRLSVCDNVLANIEEALQKSEALRQSILKKAFEGRLLSEAELEACKKEPDWEPAEKLIKKLRIN